MRNIDIVNTALGYLGANPIAIIDDSTPAGRVANRTYSTIRDRLLASREWTFAKDRIAPALAASAPAFGYSYQYIVPNNVLRVIRCYESDGRTPIDSDTGVGAGGPANSFAEPGEQNAPAWVVESGYIRTNQAAPIYAEALLAVTENGFPAHFCDALAAHCAAEWAMALTENRAVAADWRNEARVRTEESAYLDGQQGRAQVRTVPKLPGRRR